MLVEEPIHALATTLLLASALLALVFVWTQRDGATRTTSDDAPDASPHATTSMEWIQEFDDEERALLDCALRYRSWRCKPCCPPPQDVLDSRAGFQFLEAVLKWALENDEEDFLMLHTCCRALCWIADGTAGVIPFAVVNLLLEQVLSNWDEIREIASESIRCQVLESAIKRMLEYLKLFGILEEACDDRFRGYRVSFVNDVSSAADETRGDDNEWQTRFLRQLQENETTDVAVYAALTLVGHTIRLCDYGEAIRLLQDEEFCVQRIQTLGLEHSVLQHLLDCETLIDWATDGLEPLSETFLEDTCNILAACLEENATNDHAALGTPMYDVGMFLVRHDNHEASMAFFDKARQHREYALRDATVAVGRALHSLGLAYYMHKNMETAQLLLDTSSKLMHAPPPSTLREVCLLMTTNEVPESEEGLLLYRSRLDDRLQVALDACLALTRDAELLPTEPLEELSDTIEVLTSYLS